MRNFDSEGERLSLPVPAAGVLSGEYLRIGGISGWAEGDVAFAAGVFFDFIVTGVGRVPKTGGAGIEFAIGDPVYLDESVSLASVSDRPVGPLIGYATKAANDAATQVTIWKPKAGDLSDADGASGVARGVLDATAGIPIGDVLFGDAVPEGAVVERTYYSVETTAESAGDNATIGLGWNTDDAAGMVAAVAIDDGGNPWDAGLHEGIQTGVAANFSERMTAARQFEANIAVEALTAGVIVAFARWVFVV